MELKNIEWNGFKGFEFIFENNYARIILPNCIPNGKWALKTEYSEAFPNTEIELLNRGWHVAFNQNDNRWAEEKDLLRKANFVKFIPKRFNLNEKCLLIGMSCGGLYAVKLTAIIPNLIQMLYLDAPVLNLLSCPCCMGVATDDLYPEFFEITKKSKSEMLSYRDHPIDKMDILLNHDIPILLICGDSDTTVPYEENGKILKDYYERNGGKIYSLLKKNCGHHPHGHNDPKIAVDVIENLTN